jgi:hypothetical protein
MNRSDLEATTRAPVARGQGVPGPSLERLHDSVPAARGVSTQRSRAL